MGFLRRAYWRLLPPLELEVTIDEVRAFIEKNAPYSRNLLEKELSLLWKKSEDIVYTIRFEGRTPHILALHLIANLLSSHVASGRHHFYQGHLNSSGIEMLKAWVLAVDQLVENGFYDEADAFELKCLMENRIREMG